MIKKTPAEVIRAVAAAMADGRGRLRSQADQYAEADAAEREARDEVEVVLHDFEVSKPEDRIAVLSAAARYRDSLERALGGAEQVLRAARAGRAAIEDGVDQLSQGEMEILRRRSGVEARARAAGLHGLSPLLAAGAWFALKVHTRTSPRPSGPAPQVESQPSRSAAGAQPAPKPPGPPPAQGSLF